jgi:hypothetical protein
VVGVAGEADAVIAPIAFSFLAFTRTGGGGVWVAFPRRDRVRLCGSR